MCGIVGYAGRGEALPFLMSGLRRLEYRGYDSAGVAVLDRGHLALIRTVGRIADLEERLGDVPAPGSTGIGHTRWATHGRPSDLNAHPHLGCRGDVAVAHNGIIENHLELRDELRRRGHTFSSETDTEVIAHLLEEEDDVDLTTAVEHVAGRLRGSYAFAVVREADPDVVVATRELSPLVAGLGDGENFLASDIPALLERTRRVLVIEDGEVVTLTPESVSIRRNGVGVRREVLEVPWNLEEAERGGHPHFMIKEILEQPKALRATLAGRISTDISRVTLDFALPAIPRKVWLVGCGTSYHAGLVGRRLIEEISRIPAEAELASELRYLDPILGPDDLVVALSQSGETLDTMAAIRSVKEKGARVLAITNVIGSSIFREADYNLPTQAGPEIAVASSKAYTTQITALTLLAITLGRMTGRLGADEEAAWAKELWALPERAELILDRRSELKPVAKRLAEATDVFFVGRGLDHALAMEGQLKLKEISYLHAEALAAGELKHGTLALIEPGVPVVALLSQEALASKTRSNIAEIKARGGWIYALVGQAVDEGSEVDGVFRLPKAAPAMAALLEAIPLQLLAYETALERGTDIDKPRNLAKSVTVE